MIDDRAWSLKFEEALCLIDPRYSGNIHWQTVVFLYGQLACPFKAAEAYSKVVPL